MNNVSDIRVKYPEAYKAKPKGWKFIVGKTRIAEGDMVWFFGSGPYKTVNADDFSCIGQEARIYLPIIRQIKTKTKTQTKPKITPLPEYLKASLLKGYVYLGKGGEFKVPNNEVCYKCIFIYSQSVAPQWTGIYNAPMISSSDGYYAFPADSEIVKFNGVKPKTSLLEENAALRKELEELKRKVKEFAKSLD